MSFNIRIIFSFIFFPSAYPPIVNCTSVYTRRAQAKDKIRVPANRWNCLNRTGDNYADDNNKSNNNFISAQSRVKSLLNGVRTAEEIRGSGERGKGGGREGQPRRQARI